ncbi:LOW QUALITY PROTEIN: SET and MYND domain-containing protein 4-like [Pollicipes pollicipes]|uniref:LOW QUALITY PROTEIN: SET and MYND domain-containing protein 4-like n=1 Tax=Pollicipes pollicipes TaxID=41117 RepID=UPI0018854C0C|nr:LOW QUALITY PROTEIN: SET and MYND domain-containing protein 4-like [Pollicipes pollicipes]
MAVIDAGYKRLCSDATLQTKKDGYFMTFDSQPAASGDEAHKMAVIDAGYKRLCSDATLQTKKDGYFMTFDSQVQLEVCRGCSGVLTFCDTTGDLLSIGFANRSAALLHMGEYALCLRDITAALAAGYPARLRDKLLDRRATCQLKLGEVTASRGTLQELKTALTVVDLNEKKKPVLQAELEQPAPPPLPSRGGHFVSASAAVDVAHAAGEGRYAVAAQHVQPGDVLVVEKPHASVLMAEKMSTHCLHCLKRVLTAFPCAACSSVVFCSPECAAAATYHCWECTILDLLQASGMSVLCHLALRLVTSYLAVHQLVTLGELRKPEDFFHRTLMAVLLLKHLRMTGYLGEILEDDGKCSHLIPELKDSSLLHHLQLLQFNAHEVGEYVMMEPGQFKQSRRIYIGVAVYPTVSFFNHSCEGGVSRCLVGDTLVVHSVQHLAPGNHISENYGPVYSHKPLRDRQHWLRSRHWFECKCVACVEDWPDYDQFDHTKVSIKCQGCGSGITS